MTSRAATIEEFDEQGYALASGILSERELDAMRAEMDRLIQEAPTEGDRDANGKTVSHPGEFAFTEDEAGGRVLQRISNQLARSQVMRIVYGNPRLLELVASVYGREFVPFAESIIVKLPENGSPVAWHQDGNRHEGVEHRGLNTGIYLHPSTEANGCLRVIPGSHRLSKVDVRAMREEHGDILPDSIPLETSGGDISLHDRSLIHGSLSNASPDLRITVYFGYHKLGSVKPIHDTAHIRRRASIVNVCMEERRQSGWFPGEKPYNYALSDFAQLPPDGERDDVLRTPLLGI